MIIQPTIGHIVWFWDAGRDPKEAPYQPAAAIVTHVHSDRLVNLTVFSPHGAVRPMTSIELCQPGNSRPDGGFFCEWMPYQIGQAEKNST